MEDDIDPLTEQKQNYLRQNILERGYDGNTFANFLIQKKVKMAQIYLIGL